MDYQNNILEIRSNKESPIKTTIIINTRKFIVTFLYFYIIDNPHKVYDELLDEKLFINKKEFFCYMKIFSNPNSRILAIKYI